MSDHSLPIREAVIQVLRADPTIIGLAGARVYETVPDNVAASMPYIRYGAPIIQPFEATAITGVALQVTIHVFDEAPDTDRTLRLMEAVRAALQEQPLTISVGADHYWTTWTGSGLLEDGSGKHNRHGIVSFNITTG